MSDSKGSNTTRYPATRHQKATEFIDPFFFILPISVVPIAAARGEAILVCSVLAIIASFVYQAIRKKQKARGVEWYELSDDQLIFHGYNGVKRFALNGLSTSSTAGSFRLTVTTLEGRKQTLPHPALWSGTRPVAEEFFLALAKRGVSLQEINLKPDIYDSSSYRLETKLTSAVNWRWQGCVKLDQFQEHKTKLADTQVIKISNETVYIFRKGFELLSAPIKDCRLIRVLGGQGETMAIRYLLEVRGKDKWPLLDWNAHEREGLKEAFLNRKVPLIQDPPAEEPETEYLTDTRKIIISYNDLSHKVMSFSLMIPYFTFVISSVNRLGILPGIFISIFVMLLLSIIWLFNNGHYIFSADGIAFSAFGKDLALKFQTYPLSVHEEKARLMNQKLTWMSKIPLSTTPDLFLAGDPGIERLRLLKQLQERGVQTDVMGVKELKISEAFNLTIKQRGWPSFHFSLFIMSFAVGGFWIFFASLTRAAALSVALSSVGAISLSLLVFLYVNSVNDWPSPINQRTYKISERGLEVSTKRGILHSIAFGEIRHLVLETRKGILDQNSVRLSIRTLYGRRLVISRWTTRMDQALLTLISLARGKGIEVIIADKDMVDRHKEGEEGEVLYEARKPDGPTDAVINMVGEETDVENQHA